MKPFWQKLLIAALCFIALGSMAPAQAAHWQVSYKVDGENGTTNYPYKQPWNDPDFLSSEPDVNYDSQSGEFTSPNGFWNGYFITGVRIQTTSEGQSFYPGALSWAKGTVTVIMTWAPNYEGEILPPTPEQVSIKVTGHAFARYAGLAANTQTTARVDEEVGQTSEYVTVLDPSTNYYDRYTATPNYTFVVTQKVPAGENRVEFVVPLQSQVASPPGETNAGQFGGGTHDIGNMLKGEEDDRHPYLHVYPSTFSLPLVKEPANKEMDAHVKIAWKDMACPSIRCCRFGKAAPVFTLARHAMAKS